MTVEDRTAAAVPVGFTGWGQRRETNATALSSPGLIGETRSCSALAPADGRGNAALDEMVEPPTLAGRRLVGGLSRVLPTYSLYWDP